MLIQNLNANSLIKKAAGVSNMSTKELYEALNKTRDTNKLEAIVQQGLIRNSMEIFMRIASDPSLLANTKILSVTLSYLEGCDLKDASNNVILENLLNNAQNLNATKITAIVTKNHFTSAIALMAKNTPIETVDAIILTLNHLNIPNKTPSTHPILQNILDLMRWANIRSAILLLTRILQNPSDPFILSAAHLDLDYAVASVFISASKLNNSLNKALKENQYQDTKAALWFSEALTKGIRGIDEVLDFFKVTSTTSAEQVLDMWNLISNSILNMSALTGGNKEDEPISLKQIFTYSTEGKTVVDYLIEKDISVIPLIIDFLKKEGGGEEIYRTPSFSRLVYIGLNNASIREKILEMSKECFAVTSMTPEHRKIVQDHFYSPQETPKLDESDLEELIGSGKNWYQKFSSL